MLQLDNINVYYGESHILRNVSFEAEVGQVLCLMGRNGVGKTTTLKAITGLLAPRSGRVCLDGRDVTGDAPDRRVKRGLGYVPQGREILPHLTVRENLRLGFWARPAVSNGVTEKDAFEEVFALFPKLTQLLERPGGVLSGGEQQQVAIARALLSKPRILLLDEPTEGIQPNIVDLIEEVIVGLKAKRLFTILLVEQGLQFAARLADAYVIMAKGAVVASGRTSELSEEQVKQHLVV
ncbi:MAG: urea ABC transporter ATP-binding subunit UrtE [Nitrospiraceae bacterium]|nr:urea ABC transporter ATP-binding subunit UrtE [Nitrospiraceae bacterium]MSR23700.1 urea ABC transporter ATP-binding subunit UrtE [Nitrospiraceae bacterium]